MRRARPHLLALVLGAGTAVLVACGGAGGTTGGVPAASAGGLKSELEDVSQAVEGGRCDEVTGQLRQVDTAIDDLPASVDERLRQALRDASDKLRRAAVSECGDDEPTRTTTQTQTTETTIEPTETTPPTGTQTAPPQTATTPPETPPDPVPPVAPPPPPVQQPPAPVPPPVVPPASPPAPPSGGAAPEIEPEG